MHASLRRRYRQVIRLRDRGDWMVVKKRTEETGLAGSVTGTGGRGLTNQPWWPQRVTNVYRILSIAGPRAHPSPPTSGGRGKRPTQNSLVP